MDEAAQAQFMSITGASPATATQYLQFAEGDLEGAIELFYANDGASLEQSTTASQAPPVPPPSTRPTGQERGGVVHLDSDDEDLPDPESDGEIEVTGSRRRGLGSARTEAALGTPPVANSTPGAAVGVMDDDEAIARRLQEEYYGIGGGPSAERSSNTDLLDEHGYRAPIERTTETLIGPESFDPSNADEMRAAVLEQMAARRQRPPRPRDLPGIFNQSPSMWNDRDQLARATGGSAQSSDKAMTLAGMFRPPFELMCRLPWEEARDQGKEELKWILVDIQDPSIFDCQALNRDIWKHEGIVETVRENFLFMQYSKDDQRGSQYMQYYFQDKDVDAAYPHIAIVDPRTGEQVKKWSGRPAPKAADFLMQLHEFLDRYSLNVAAKNPVAKRKPEVKKEARLSSMTEEQQMEMAMQASLAAGHAQAKDEDPDDLTKSFGDIKGKGIDGDEVMPETSDGAYTNGASQATIARSPFSQISSTKPHNEPAPTGPNTTRIQFRHPNGRVVRRFLLTDPVRTLYEWLKAAPLEGQAGKEFELVFMQKNLIDSLDKEIEQAGLKNGTVMVEIIEGESQA